MFEYGEFRDHPLTKTIPVWHLQKRESDHGAWETVERYSGPTAEQEARYAKTVQDMSASGVMYRTVRMYEPNPDYGRFQVGMRVKIHESTALWAQGFKYGRVTRVGFAFVTVAWSGSDEVAWKLIPEFIAPEIVNV